MGAHLAAFAAALTPDGGGKLRRSLAARSGAVGRLERWARASRDMRRPLIWMHAASVGEGLMARPVLELLRSRLPDAQYAYTFFSPSAEAFARSLPVDIAEYLPFDTARAARVVLDALAPSALVFSKLDVWPNLVAESVARSVPVALTSATLAESSGRTTALGRMILGDAYASLNAVGAVSSDDAARFVSLGVRADRVIVTGDVRYDQVWAQAAAAPRQAELVGRLRSERPTLVAGSTWPSDEAHLLPAWAEFIKRVPQARLIVAAHEPSAAHTSRLRGWAGHAGLVAEAIPNATADTDVVIVDRVGILADLYALGAAAYVGGGFHGKGLHSVVEPAAHGVPVLFGPRGTTSRDAAALLAAGGAFAGADAAALAARITDLLVNTDARSRASASARQVVVDGLGAAEKSAALVARLLPADGAR